MIRASENESTKLLATLFNSTGVAMITIGFITPMVGFLYGVLTAPPLWQIAIYGAGWLAGGFVLHLFGVIVLKDLDP